MSIRPQSLIGVVPGGGVSPLLAWLPLVQWGWEEQGWFRVQSANSVHGRPVHMASVRIVAQAMEMVASRCMGSLLLACQGGGVLPLAVLLGEKLVGVMAGPALSTPCWTGTLSSIPAAGIRVCAPSPQVMVRIRNAP